MTKPHNRAEDFRPQRRPRYEIDMERLCRRVNMRRILRGMPWEDVGIETGLSNNVLQRLVAGRPLSLNSYITLCVWLDLHPRFVRRVDDDPTFT